MKQKASDGVETFNAASSGTVLVAWPDAPLKTHESASIRAQALVTCTAGEIDSDWSTRTSVKAALFEPHNWSTAISCGTTNEAKHPDGRNTCLEWFRNIFNFTEIGTRSKLYLTEMGIYEALLNGERIGGEYLAAGRTASQHRVQF